MIIHPATWWPILLAAYTCSEPLSTAKASQTPAFAINQQSLMLLELTLFHFRKIINQSSRVFQMPWSFGDQGTPLL
jgi:hypothetical protein